MDATHAKVLLGLSEQFDYAELDAAYRRAASDARGVPADRQEELLRALNAAREVLGEALGPRPGADLIPLRSAVPARVQPVSSAEVERLAAASGQVVQTVTVQHVGRLARLKQRRFTLGVLLGGLSVVGLLIRLTINFGGVTNESGQTHYSGLSPNTVAVITIVLASLSAIFWALGWAVRSRERYVQMQIERLAETLTDRATIADLFDEVGVDSLWTRNELREAIRTWTERSAPRSLHAPSRRKGLFHWLGFLAPDEHEEALSEVANKLGATDFTSLLVAKAIETQVVKEVAIVGPDGRRRHGYGFSV